MDKKPYNNKIIKLHDGTAAMFYFGKWVDPQTKAAIDPAYYPEIKEPQASAKEQAQPKNQMQKEDKASGEIIHGGAVVLARKITESNIWTKHPAEWLKIWLWIILNASHKENENLKRGELFTNYKKIQEQNNVTRGQVDAFFRVFRRGKKLTTRKTTRGLYIFILNYDKYQNLNNFERHEKRKINDTKTTLYNKNEQELKKKENIKRKKNLDFEKLPKHYLEKLRSKNKSERVLTMFYVFTGYFGDFWELGVKIRGDLLTFYTEIEAIKKVPDDKIKEIMANLSDKNQLTIPNIAAQASASSAQVVPVVPVLAELL
jgi:hypothetical protein